MRAGGAKAVWNFPEISSSLVPSQKSTSLSLASFFSCLLSSYMSSCEWCKMMNVKCKIWNPKSKRQNMKCKIQNAVFWAESNSFLPPTHVKVGAQQRLSLETEFRVIWKTKTEDFKKISNFDWWHWGLRWWNVYKLYEFYIYIFLYKKTALRHQEYFWSGKASLAGLSCFQ